MDLLQISTVSDHVFLVSQWVYSQFYIRCDVSLPFVSLQELENSNGVFRGALNKI